jgi:hypothetical protein
MPFAPQVSGLKLLLNRFGDDTDGLCPPAYPHRIARGSPNAKHGLCYRAESDAAAGTGRCGAWCAGATEWPVVAALWGGACGRRCPAVPMRPPTTKTHSGAAVPEAAWLLHRVLEYAHTALVPSKTLRVKMMECRGCFPDSFVALCQ